MFHINVYVFLCISGFCTVYGYVSTSTFKLKQFIVNRNNLTQEIQKYIEYEEKRWLDLNKTTGYEDELEYIKIRTADLTQLLEETEYNRTQKGDITPEEIITHPIRSYLYIKHFVFNYRTRFSNKTIYGDKYFKLLNCPYLNTPQISDMRDAIHAIIRIQMTYNLTAADIVAGSLFGRNSPDLNPADVYVIGINAHDKDFPTVAVPWLELALQTLNTDCSNAVFDWQTAIKRLVFIYNAYGKDNKLQPLLQMGMDHGDTSTHHRLQLKWRHEKLPRQVDAFQKHTKPWSHYVKFCNQQNAVETIKNYHRCRYRLIPSSPAYYRYKEQILNTTPYISVIYDVLVDEDLAELKTQAASQLKTPRERSRSNGEIAELLDSDYKIAAKITERLSDVTGLNIDSTGNSNQTDNLFLSQNPLQVINYGVGGHNEDYLEFTSNKQLTKPELRHKLASSILFVNTVDVGGHVIFPELKISVKPVKGSVLFWYNYNKNKEPQTKTWKYSCPVVFGEKWEARRGIGFRGNHPNPKKICKRRKLQAKRRRK